MKKLVFVAVGAILLLGVLAVAAVLLVGDGGDAGSSPAPSVPAPTASTGPLSPSGPPPEAVAPAPGPKRVRLPRGYVKVELTEPLRPCFVRFPPVSQQLAVLTLDLEARPDSGFTVIDSRVKSWGDASAALVQCAQEMVRGRRVTGSKFPAGEHVESDYELEIPESILPPAPEPPPTSLPTNRQQPPRRSGSR